MSQRTGPNRRSRHTRSRGLALVESVMGIVLVSLVLVCALKGAGMITVSRRVTLERVQGRQLAESLMAEIVVLPYTDPDTASLLIGLDTGETSGSRSSFDDVDDFNGYSQAPVQDRNNVALMNDGRWEWKVVVDSVNPAAPNGSAVVTAANGLKRVTVTVSLAGKTVYTLRGLRGAVD